MAATTAGFHMSVGEAREALSRAKASMSKVREKAEEAIKYGIQVAEGTAAAMAFGYANSKFGGENGEMQVFGLPVDLCVGLGLTGVGMFGGFGKYDEHGINMGVGALACYATRAGFQLAGHHPDASAAKLAYRPAAMNAAPTTTTSGEWDPHSQTYHVYDQGP